MTKVTILAMSSVASMAIAFTFILKSEADASSLYFILGVILFVFSCLGWYKAIDLAKAEDEKRDRKDNRLIKLLEAIARKLGVDIKDIK